MCVVLCCVLCAARRVELTTGPDDSSRLDKGVVSIDIRGQSVSTGMMGPWCRRMHGKMR